MELSTLRTLGRSGLPVSPLALGTMTFGNRGWGSPDEVSKAIFDAYVEAGGNFVDTADVYGGGRSEELVGEFVGERGLRDRVVVATKFSFQGGNGRKNMYRALEGSLRRLKMEYVDLYWAHVWDRVTPAEELLESMVAMVRSGKVRYFGLSDVPAWYAARMSTLAAAHGVPGPIALQLVYSLAERGIEQEHVPAAMELGMGVTPWSPLGAGFLTGKYSRNERGEVQAGGGRLDGKNQPFRMFTERNWAILEVLRAVSAEAGKPMSQVALAWVQGRPGMTSLIFGANTVEQLRGNVGSLEVGLSAEQRRRLDEVSAPEAGFYALFGDGVHKGIFGGKVVQGWTEPAWPK